MAIHCMNPNTIGDDAESVFNVTMEAKNTFLTKFSDLIARLGNDWKGSDATKNINDLCTVYNETGNYFVQILNTVADFNNNNIIPLQNSIVAVGGECKVGNSLPEASSFSSVSFQPSEESFTSENIAADAIFLAECQKYFTDFRSNFDSAKEKLLNNWLEGANRDNVYTFFKSFDDSVDSYINVLNNVKIRLDEIVTLKQSFM